MGAHIFISNVVLASGARATPRSCIARYTKLHQSCTVYDGPNFDLAHAVSYDPTMLNLVAIRPYIVT